MAVVLQSLLTKYFYIPGAISIQMIDQGTVNYRAQVMVMSGTAIRVTPEMSELIGADGNNVMNYANSLSYRTWSLEGYNTRFSFAYEDAGNGYRLRVPIYIYVRLDASSDGSTGMIVFSPYAYNLLGKVYTDYDNGNFTSNDADRVEALLGQTIDPDNPTYRVYAPSNVTSDGTYELNFYYVRIGMINTDGYVDMPYGTLGADAGLKDTLSELFLRRDQDDTALFRYTFKELVLGSALLSYDTTNNALKVSGIPATRYETVTDEEGNESQVPVTETPTMNLYATGGVSAYGINSGSGSGSGGSGGTGHEGNCVNEVYVGTETPTDTDVELWVDPSVQTADQFYTTTDENGDVWLNVPDYQAILKAKYNNHWITMNLGGTGSSSTGTNVSWGAATPYSSELVIQGSSTKVLTLAPSVMGDDKYYMLTKTGWAEFTNGNDTTYSAGTGIDISSAGKISVKLASNGYITSTNGLAIDTSFLKTLTIKSTSLSKTETYTPTTDKEIDIDDFIDDIYVKKEGDTMTGSLSITTLADADSNLIVGKGGVKIGSYLLQETNDGLRLSKEGTNEIANFYATGGVSAYGAVSSSAPTYVTSLNGSTGALNLKSIKIGTTTYDLIGNGTIVVPEGGGGDGTGTITLIGDVSGSGTGTVNVSIGTGKVTNSMLAGNITNAKLANSSMTICGTSVALGGSLTADTMKSNLGLKDLAYESKDTIALTKYVRKDVDDTKTGMLSMNGDITMLTGKNINMPLGGKIGYALTDNTPLDNSPWYGMALYGSTGDVHTHIGGYYGICLHTNNTGEVRLYNNTTPSDTNSAPGKLRIGNAVLSYDDTNKALYLQNADGSAGNFYATGGVSAYGIFNGTPLANLTLTDTLSAKKLKINSISITANADDSTIIVGADTLDVNEIVASENIKSDTAIEAPEFRINGTKVTAIVPNSSLPSGKTETNMTKKYIKLTVGGTDYYVPAFTN